MLHYFEPENIKISAIWCTWNA